jgi:hypothetical protein
LKIIWSSADILINEGTTSADVNKKSISTFVKIRISNSNINIEKGRYLNTPAEDRICKLCNSGVDCVFSFLYVLNLFPPDLLLSLNNNVFQCLIYICSLTVL